jgi:hypothetical protein
MTAGNGLELKSHRLCLKRVRTEDASFIASYRSLPEVARFQSWESFALDDAASLIAGQVGVTPNTPGTWERKRGTTNRH